MQPHLTVMTKPSETTKREMLASDEVSVDDVIAAAAVRIEGAEARALAAEIRNEQLTESSAADDQVLRDVVEAAAVRIKAAEDEAAANEEMLHEAVAAAAARIRQMEENAVGEVEVVRDLIEHAEARAYAAEERAEQLAAQLDAMTTPTIIEEEPTADAPRDAMPERPKTAPHSNYLSRRVDALEVRGDDLAELSYTDQLRKEHAHKTARLLARISTLENERNSLRSKVAALRAAEDARARQAEKEYAPLPSRKVPLSAQLGPDVRPRGSARRRIERARASGA